MQAGIIQEAHRDIWSMKGYGQKNRQYFMLADYVEFPQLWSLCGPLYETDPNIEGNYFYSITLLFRDLNAQVLQPEALQSSLLDLAACNLVGL